MVQSYEELEQLTRKLREEQFRKESAAREAFLTNNSNRVIVMGSQEYHTLHGKGKFRIAYFTFPPPEKKYVSVVGFRRAITNKVFCYVYDNKDNDLNANWTRAQRYDFNPRKVIDYQRMQEWYAKMKKKGYQISAFYCER